MIARSFYFLRHGETDWNLEGRLQGQTDTPLNDTGRMQARDAIAVLQKHPIDVIVSSPLLRAYETAEIVNKILKKPIHKNTDLMERHYGLFEGKTKQDIDLFNRENPERAAIKAHPSAPFNPPEAEEYALFCGRVFKIFAHMLDQHNGQNVLFVGHGGIYRALCRDFFGDTDLPANAQPYQFLKIDTGWELVLLK